MMAAAEARAVWQRTSNRFFIQEDAKRAPKLATSSLLSKQEYTKPPNVIDLNDSFPLPNDKYSYSNFSSESKWWLQPQPDYIHQRGLTLTSDEVNTLEGQNPHQFVENQDSSSVSSMSKESFEFIEMDLINCFKEVNDIEKICELPWWQMAEKDNFDSFISNDLIKKKIKCQNPISQGEVKAVTSKPIHGVDFNKSKILEALRHSQTRARKAEIAVKEAYLEKEHVIKLLFKQASQLFAYRQWIYLLQLENLYYQIKNDKNNPISSKNGKLHTNVKKSPHPKGKKRARNEHDIGKYAVVFVVGLGLVGAGLLLGWTVGWMLI